VAIRLLALAATPVSAADTDGDGIDDAVDNCRQIAKANQRDSNADGGTAFLYLVGQGLVPWEARGVFGDFSTEMEDSCPIAPAGLLGGSGTLSYQYSNEPQSHFLQMPTNLSSVNGQVVARLATLPRCKHRRIISMRSSEISLFIPAPTSCCMTWGPALRLRWAKVTPAARSGARRQHR
jgi:hypothetical protein